MPHDFDPQKRRYRFNGRLVSRQEVRAEIDKLTEFVSNEAASIGRRFADGSINASEFRIELRELLKSAHIVAASVGRGGREQMTQTDWGRVGAKIKWQYQFLEKFAKRVESGRISPLSTTSRARSYASALYVSYSNARQETQTEFIAGSGDRNPGNEMLCYLEQHSQEGCEECTADADAGAVPVSEMGEIGSRICGDFCRCTIVFEDEPEFQP